MLPPILADMTGGERNFVAHGATLGAALEDLCQNVPTLRVHLFDEKGTPRRFVLCVHEDCYIRPPDIPGRPLKDGDEVRIMNALAGG